VDCVVLQVKTRPGEYAQPGPLATPLMIVGSLDSLTCGSTWTRTTPGGSSRGRTPRRPSVAMPRSARRSSSSA
jgi:hypothetical protein